MLEDPAVNRYAYYLVNPPVPEVIRVTTQEDLPEKALVYAFTEKTAGRLKAFDRTNELTTLDLDVSEPIPTDAVHAFLEYMIDRLPPSKGPSTRLRLVDTVPGCLKSLLQGAPQVQNVMLDTVFVSLTYDSPTTGSLLLEKGDARYPEILITEASKVMAYANANMYNIHVRDLTLLYTSTDYGRVSDDLIQ